MSSLATRARKHQAGQAAVALAGVRAVRKAAKKASTAGEAKAATATTLATYQLASALNGARAMAGEFGRDVLTAPLEYVGTTELGYSIGAGINTIVDTIARDLEQEWAALTDDLMASLDRMVFNEVVAAGTDAQSAEVFAEDALYVRVLVPPSCDRCTILAGRTYRSEEAFERHPQCFPAGTVVSGPAPRGASRRAYQGELVVIRTAGGKKLSVTANHPILTDKGWVPARLLAEGGYVVGRASGDRSSALLIPNHDQVPARIEDLWSAGRVGSLRRMPVAPEDFHGDGLGSSEVDVVLLDRRLRNGQQVALLEQSRKQLLALGAVSSVALDRLRASKQLALGHGLAALGPMGSLRVAGALTGTHSIGTEQGSLSRATDDHLGFYQALANHPALKPGPVRNRVLALATQVGGNDRGVIDGLSTASRTRWDAPGAEFSTKTRSAYAGLGLDLRTRLAGQVELDRVVEVTRVEWSGHVYNLTSSEGWYDAEGIIVSNCNCEHWPVGTEEAAKASGLIVDPQEAFDAGQVRGLSKADAQAILDGADFSQVVNAKRAPRRGAPGITNAISAEIFGRHVEATLSGTTKRSAWRRANPKLPIRLRPQSIYQHAKDRDDALRLLRLYGYLT